jgi:hypothetical protein
MPANFPRESVESHRWNGTRTYPGKPILFLSRGEMLLTPPRRLKNRRPNRRATSGRSFRQSPPGEWDLTSFSGQFARALLGEWAPGFPPLARQSPFLYEELRCRALFSLETARSRSQIVEAASCRLLAVSNTTMRQEKNAAGCRVYESRERSRLETCVLLSSPSTLRPIRIADSTLCGRVWKGPGAQRSEGRPGRSRVGDSATWCNNWL